MINVTEDWRESFRLWSTNIAMHTLSWKLKELGLAQLTLSGGQKLRN